MPTTEVFEFGDFRIDPNERLLLRRGTPVPLTPKAFETLLALVEHSGHVVTKADLMKRVWPDTFVEEVNLAQNVSALRRALDAAGEQHIETVPKLGYRLAVKARVVGPAEAPPQTVAVLPATEPNGSPASDATLIRWKNRRIFVGFVVAAVVLPAIGGLLWWTNGLRPRPVRARITSLAILPLENLSRDAEQEYFSDGMTDELITSVAKIRSLRVISRNSVLAYRRRHEPIPEIGRELNVDAVVEGTVVRSGSRVRITAQLIDARTDRHLWAQSYEGDLRDVLKLQDRVAEAIATEIQGTLAPEELPSATPKRTVDPDAHEADLRGFYELHRHRAEGSLVPAKEEIDRAVGFFKQALSIDPSDALANAGLAAAYYEQSTLLRAPLDVMPKAKGAAMRAVELDDSFAEAHAWLGYVKLNFDWDWPGAEREFRRALQLNPNLASAHAGYAHYLLTLGRSQQAIEELRELRNVDPLFPQFHVGLPYTLWNLRLYEEAIAAARKEGDERVIALSLVLEGRNDEAVAAADRAVKTAHHPVILSQLAYVYARAGRTERARAMLAAIETQVRQRYVCGFNVACLYAGLGDKEHAYAWLDRAYRERSD